MKISLDWWVVFRRLWLLLLLLHLHVLQSEQLPAMDASAVSSRDAAPEDKLRLVGPQMKANEAISSDVLSQRGNNLEPLKVESFKRYELALWNQNYTPDESATSNGEERNGHGRVKR